MDETCRHQVELEPVELTLVQICAYKAKPCKTCGRPKSNSVHRKSGTCIFKRQLGCAHCGQAKTHRDHFGAPPSLNVLGSGNVMAYMGVKAALERILTELLEESGLPRGLSRVHVECEVVFPDLKPRDEGNTRFFVEKALGDALVTGEWLPADTFFPVRRYTFGHIEARHEAGTSAMRLMIFPAAETTPLPDPAEAQAPVLIG